MKRAVFILAVMFIGLNMFGQSFSLTYDGEVLSPGQEVDFECELENSLNLFMNLEVTNNSNIAKLVKVEKIYVNIVEGSHNSFCWGACFGEEIFVSPTEISIAANGGISTDFIGEYNPSENAGTTSIKYKFYDKNNPSDAISLIVNYGFLTTVQEQTTSTLNIYPSPASSVVNFSLNQVSGIVNIELYNILGKKVKQLTTDASMTTKISVEDFENGFYFVKIIQNNNVIETKKLVVQH